MTSATKTYYESYWSEAGFKPEGYANAELRWIFSEFLVNRKRVLDLGCGDCKTSGTIIRALGSDYVGVDISNKAIRQGLAAGFEAYEIEDAGQLPFDNGEFDGAVCIEVMEHLFNPEKSAAEAFRVLKSGGVFIVTVPNVTYWRRRLELLVGRWNPLGDNESVTAPWRDPHIRFFTPGALSNMLSSVGFTKIVAGGMGGALWRDVPWLGKLFRGRGGKMYKAVQQWHPALLGYRCFAVGFKP